ncbi:glycosyltransferase [Alicyclobacillus tolerans]|uniref:glycosyltransferase family protein n=1 Tax=Alicyclobacillus tolerans TaxID=90970 RepID=UPI001F29B620|nr:glycosyltransferase [Alicyclobacillus tolerans]MCF8566143.1 glycosyltransferase [Alicyclobacillus tolerans]
MTQTTIVLISAVPFHTVTQRPQHFARLLAQRGWRVLYVDGPVSVLGPLRNRELLKRLVPKQPLEEIPVSGKGRLQVLTPVAGLPFGNRYRKLNQFNQRMLAVQIQRAVPGPYVVLSVLPGAVDLLEHLHPMAVLYDCVDLHAGFGGTLNPDVVNQMESELAWASRKVFASADLLLERMKQLHSDVQLLPNAAEVDHFASTATAHVHPLLENIPVPRVGLIGGMGPWVDFEFLGRLASLRPGVQFVFVGPVETDVSGVRALPNVHFLGRQPYQELPQFLAGFDATLVSFVQSELTRGVNPIKVYEYLAAGKEVISTPNPELIKLRDFLWIAESGEQAAGYLDAILMGQRRTSAEQYEQFNREHSWVAQVEKLERALLDVLPVSISTPQTLSNQGEGS